MKRLLDTLAFWGRIVLFLVLVFPVMWWLALTGWDPEPDE